MTGFESGLLFSVKGGQGTTTGFRDGHHSGALAVALVKVEDEDQFDSKLEFMFQNDDESGRLSFHLNILFNHNSEALAVAVVKVADEDQFDSKLEFMFQNDDESGRLSFLLKILFNHSSSGRHHYRHISETTNFATNTALSVTNIDETIVVGLYVSSKQLSISSLMI